MEPAAINTILLLIIFGLIIYCIYELLADEGMDAEHLKGMIDDRCDKIEGDASKKDSREEIAQSLIEYYYENFCENPIDGSERDHKIIEHLREIEERSTVSANSEDKEKDIEKVRWYKNIFNVLTNQDMAYGEKIAKYILQNYGEAYASTDSLDKDEEMKKIAIEMQKYAISWEDNARLIGNIKAKEVNAVSNYIISNNT